MRSFSVEGGGCLFFFFAVCKTACPRPPPPLLGLALKIQSLTVCGVRSLFIGPLERLVVRSFLHLVLFSFNFEILCNQPFLVVGPILIENETNGSVSAELGLLSIG